MEFVQYEFAGKILEKPPKYIRCIMLLDSMEKQAQFLSLYNDLMTDYEVAIGVMIEAGGKRPSRPPERFPILFHDYVSQINLTVNSAYQSLKLEPDNWLLVIKDSDIEVVNEKAALLKQKGLEIEIERIPYGGYNLYVENKSLMEYAGSDQLQYRLHTGSQYFARVRQGDKAQGKRMKYGFMVLMQESPCQIYESVPQKQRSDKLPESALVELPFDIIGSIYDLNRCI